MGSGWTRASNSDKLSDTGRIGLRYRQGPGLGPILGHAGSNVHHE